MERWEALLQATNNDITPTVKSPSVGLSNSQQTSHSNIMTPLTPHSNDRLEKSSYKSPVPSDMVFSFKLESAKKLKREFESNYSPNNSTACSPENSSRSYPPTPLPSELLSLRRIQTLASPKTNSNFVTSNSRLSNKLFSPALKICDTQQPFNPNILNLESQFEKYCNDVDVDGTIIVSRTQTPLANDAQIGYSPRVKKSNSTEKNVYGGESSTYQTPSTVHSSPFSIRTGANVNQTGFAINKADPNATKIEHNLASKIGSPNSFVFHTAALGLTGMEGTDNLPYEEMSETETKKRKKHACNYPGCGRAFTSSGHLTRHKRMHDGSRPYSCPFPGCEAKFSRQDNMRQHQKTHESGRRKRKILTPTSQPPDSQFNTPGIPENPFTSMNFTQNIESNASTTNLQILLNLVSPKHTNLPALPQLQYTNGGGYKPQSNPYQCESYQSPYKYAAGTVDIVDQEPSPNFSSVGLPSPWIPSNTTLYSTIQTTQPSAQSFEISKSPFFTAQTQNMGYFSPSKTISVANSLFSSGQTPVLSPVTFGKLLEYTGNGERDVSHIYNQQQQRDAVEISTSSIGGMAGAILEKSDKKNEIKDGLINFEGDYPVSRENVANDEWVEIYPSISGSLFPALK
ncbi:hypothetical protein HK098_002653 [Nowakowskiella sp. JEL0407]|nr:hypothetical protein HK098_002653 [Nowakowskiella sp. JEL0407]